MKNFTITITGKVNLKQVEILQSEMKGAKTIQELQDNFKAWRPMTLFNDVFIEYLADRIIFFNKKRDECVLVVDEK